MERKLGNLAATRLLSRIDRFYLLTCVLKRHDAWHPWIYARCREVEQAPDGRLDLWGREHYKSTLITYAGIIQEVIRDPEITISIFSHTAPRAKAFLAQIKREFEINEELKTAFGDILWANPAREAPSWSLDNGIVVKRLGNPKEQTIEAHGLVDGQPVSKHFSLLVYDDVVVPESIATPEQVEKTTKAWEMSDNLGTQQGRKWHIGTRYSYADTYEAIMAKGAVIPRIRPATDDGTKQGTPVFFRPEVWQRKCRDQGDAIIACQMLQNPIAGEQAMFDVADLQVYEVRPATLSVFVLCDPARSKKRGSDNTAIVVIGLDMAGNKYLLDGFNQRMDLQERWQHFSDLVYKWRQAPGVQQVRAGYEKFGALADLDYFREKMQQERSHFEVDELAWPSDGEGSKVDRVQRLGPDFRQHKFFLPYPTDPAKLTSHQTRIAQGGHPYRLSRPIRRKDSEGNVYDLSVQFKEQVHYFPFGGLKDLVDAASRLYDMAAKPPVMINEFYLEPEFI